MNRRRWLGGVALRLGMGAGGAWAQPAVPARSLVVLEFELVDDQNNPLTKAAQVSRLANATTQLRRELEERGLYRIVMASRRVLCKRDFVRSKSSFTAATTVPRKLAVFSAWTS